jgi:hypothetical protein
MTDDLAPTTATPGAEPSTAIVLQRGPRPLELLRQAVRLAFDAADELAERARGALGLG